MQLRKSDFGLSRFFGEPPTDSQQAEIEPLLELITSVTACDRGRPSADM